MPLQMIGGDNIEEIKHKETLGFTLEKGKYLATVVKLDNNRYGITIYEAVATSETNNSTDAYYLANEEINALSEIDKAIHSSKFQDLFQRLTKLVLGRDEGNTNVILKLAYKILHTLVTQLEINKKATIIVD